MYVGHSVARCMPAVRKTSDTTVVVENLRCNTRSVRANIQSSLAEKRYAGGGMIVNKVNTTYFRIITILTQVIFWVIIRDVRMCWLLLLLIAAQASVRACNACDEY